MSNDQMMQIHDFIMSTSYMSGTTLGICLYIIRHFFHHCLRKMHHPPSSQMRKPKLRKIQHLTLYMGLETGPLTFPLHPSGSSEGNQ